ncbi:MAG: HD domain-containing protein [Deltaproteobacteria bacterium]|nr:HD domain-containing protein [Deltaproteobacteria bacterium]
MDIQTIAQKMFSGARASHDWDHTLRVLRLCEHIGPAEKADMDVLRVAAVLHDIGRPHQDASRGSVCHAVHGAVLAEPIVATLVFSPGQKDNILHCIRTHRFRGMHVPETLEAKVLFDADKLDAIGAIGIARAYLFAGEIGARLHSPDIPAEKSVPYSIDDTGFREYRVKLSKIKDRMMTSEGKRMAGERHRFMTAFFNRFLQEYQGEM